MSAITFEALGESTLLLRFDQCIDRSINARVHAAAAAIDAARVRGVLELIPAYATLAIRYDPAQWLDHELPDRHPWRGLAAALEAVVERATATTANAPRLIEVPVCYGGAYGEDLAIVAEHTGLSQDDVVALHCAPTYQVAMLGFAPGFAYLLGLDARLQVPRRAQPRVRVPLGSVAIGGAQTGIYPRELPGGWQLLGRTPVALFDARRARPALLAPGDHVRFRAIPAEQFEQPQHPADTLE